MAKSQKLSIETVTKVSHLARLRLDAPELEAIANQLSMVLENFEQIASVDTTNVKPLLSPTDIAPVLRKDVSESFDTDKLLSNAPEKSGRLFKVPPVV